MIWFEIIVLSYKKNKEKQIHYITFTKKAEQKHKENHWNSQAINIAIQHAVFVPVGTEQLYGKVPLQHSKMWPLSSEVKLFPLRRNSVM